ncbi:MAG: hypothetical protein HOQ07_04075, partial [Sinomonas sp.]|nr:hypothetical protein [Sinomonas sp.]
MPITVVHTKAELRAEIARLLGEHAARRGGGDSLGLVDPLAPRASLGLVDPLAPRASLGLVPTMGALHHGHRLLAEAAVAENDV